MSEEKIKTDIEYIKDTLLRIEKSIEVFDKVLYRGNGTPPIVPLVKQNCEKIDKVIKDTNKNTDFITAVKITIRNFKFLVWLLSSINVGALLVMYKMISNLIK